MEPPAQNRAILGVESRNASSAVAGVGMYCLRCCSATLIESVSGASRSNHNEIEAFAKSDCNRIAVVTNGESNRLTSTHREVEVVATDEPVCVLTFLRPQQTAQHLQDTEITCGPGTNQSRASIRNHTAHRLEPFDPCMTDQPGTGQPRCSLQPQPSPSHCHGRSELA